MSSEWQADGYVVHCGYIADNPYFALGNGQLQLGAQQSRVFQPMQEDLLAACVSSDGRSIIVSGDAGHIRRCHLGHFTTRLLVHTTRKRRHV